MAKKEPTRGATGPMFHTYPDSHSVDFACNAHPASDYGTTSRLLDPSIPLARQVANQVFGPSPRMDFDSRSVDPMKPLPSAREGWDDIVFASLLKKGTR